MSLSVGQKVIKTVKKAKQKHTAREKQAIELIKMSETDVKYVQEALEQEKKQFAQNSNNQIDQQPSLKKLPKKTVYKQPEEESDTDDPDQSQDSSNASHDSSDLSSVVSEQRPDLDAVDSEKAANGEQEDSFEGDEENITQTENSQKIQEDNIPENETTISKKSTNNSPEESKVMPKKKNLEFLKVLGLTENQFDKARDQVKYAPIIDEENDKDPNNTTCCICFDSEIYENDEIVLCDLCCSAVHQT